jgi:hypothetical protein
MGQVRHTRARFAVLLTAAALLTGLLTGCAANPPVAQSATTTTTTTMTGSTIPAPATPNPPTPAVPHKPVDGGRGGDRSTAGPADWPPDLPLPAGTITGSTGSKGQWTVLILAAGSATDVRRAAAAFYTAAGFTAVTESVLNRGNRQITLVVENLDHSGSQTNLVIQVSTT